MAAIQIRKLDRDAEIDVFTKRDNLGCPPCPMVLVLSGDVANWDELIGGFRHISFWEKRKIGIHLNTEVSDIARDRKYIIAGGKKYKYDKLILALGAISSVPSLPGLDGKNEFSLSTDMADGVALANVIGRYKRAAVIGSGFIALEIAQALKARGYTKIFLLVRSDVLRAHIDEEMAQRIRNLITENDIEFILPAQIQSMVSKGEKKHVVLPDRELEVDLVFFGTGSEPNTNLARRAGLKIGETGGISVNKYLQTSDLDIYAVGDCIDNWDAIARSKRQHQLSTTALRTGYIAGRNVTLGNHFVYEGTVMPFITKIFGHQIGAVGFTEREATEKGFTPISVVVDTPRLRETVRGHPKPAHYKLIADKKMKTLIGAQIISQEAVSSTIDKLAVGIAAKIPLFELVQIDSCYSPHVQEDQLAIPMHRLVDLLT